MTIRAVVFDIGETVLDDSREFGAWADWIGVPRHTFSAVLGAVTAEGSDNAETFQYFRPGFNLAAERQRAEAFFPSLRPATGLRALDEASAPLAVGSSRDALAVYGSLHMRAGVLAACGGLAEAADSHLAEARDIARRVPDAVYCGTASGPSSVQIHKLTAAAEMGDSRAVLRIAAGWQPPAAVPAERRSHYFIELARAQLWAGQRAEALVSLQAARRIAPEHTRHNLRVRETAATLVRLQHHPRRRAPQLQ